MANTSKKHNSINDQTAQLLRMNNNTIELVTKLDQALSSNDSFITVKLTDANGKDVTAQFPTVGFFKQELDRINKTVQILSGTGGNPVALQLANNEFKRILTADLNFEPKAINNLSPVSTFRTDPNWIFETLLNPMISVEIDLTDKIGDDVRTIQARRFIVTFEKIVTVQQDGTEVVTLTTDGQTRLNEFNANYKGQSNIDINAFATWLDSPGLVNRVDDTLVDEVFYRIEPNRLQFKGDFTVLSTETDIVNKKLWYVLDTLTYYDVSDPTVSPKPVQLAVGDYLNVNPNIADVKSTTVYKVIEISTTTSELRVRFEAVYGSEPIPVRLNALSFYSDKVDTRKVKVGVAYDEYSVVFLRPVDDLTNLIAKNWSPGIGFYTNELRLDNNAGETFSDFYISKVLDYGIILEDLTQKKLPNYYSVKPNAPVLDVSHFKVVQANTHLTQTVEAEQVRDLHNQKNNLTSEIQQIQNAIDKQNKKIATTIFESQADRKRADNDLASLQKKLATKNQTKFSVVQDILASKKNINKLNPDFRVRGFWPMPEAATSTKTSPQEVVQFVVWYKKMSKSGNETPILTVPDLSNSAARTSSSQNTTVDTNISKPRTVNAAFSNWQKFKTDARKRVQDKITGQWKWEIEDVSNANTPNINQLDIPISPGEKIQIKVVSLSEAGFPETPAESDFSNLIEIEFPDDLNNVLSDDQFILSAAQSDEIKVQFQNELNARGLESHLSSSFSVENVYYAHKADAIASGFNDASSGKVINLYDQLVLMINRIKSLEEQISKSKGTLQMFLLNKGNKTQIFTGNNLAFNLTAEDYMTQTKVGLATNPQDIGSRFYKNELIIVKDFAIQIVNSSTDSPLGLLSNRGYGQPPGLQPSTFAYDGTNAQAILVDTTGEIKTKTNSPGSFATYPLVGTQQNNQWLWLQIKDELNNAIYYNDTNQPSNNFWDANTGASSAIDDGISVTAHNGVVSKTQNLGYRKPANNSVGTSINPVNSLSNQKMWSIIDWDKNDSNPFNTAGYRGGLGTTIHPVVNSLDDITDVSAQLIKLIQPGSTTNTVTIPIYIYLKPYTGTYQRSGNTASGSAPYEIYVDNLAAAAAAPGAGDMPTIDNTGNFTQDGTTKKLLIPVTADTITKSPDILKAGDKIVMVGLPTTLAALEGKLLTVLDTTASPILVDYVLPNGFAAVGVASSTIAQAHKLIDLSINNNTSSPLYVGGVPTSKECRVWNVEGSLPGVDTKYVDNYIEFYASAGTPTPITHTKKLKFYMDLETSIRPIEFQFAWNITHYKKIQNVTSQGGFNNTQ